MRLLTVLARIPEGHKSEASLISENSGAINHQSARETAAAKLAPSQHARVARSLYRHLIKGMSSDHPAASITGNPERHTSVDVHTMHRHAQTATERKAIQKLAYHTAHGRPVGLIGKDYYGKLEPGKYWAAHNKVVSPKWHKEQARYHIKMERKLVNAAQNEPISVARRMIQKSWKHADWADKHKEKAEALSSASLKIAHRRETAAYSVDDAEFAAVLAELGTVPFVEEAAAGINHKKEADKHYGIAHEAYRKSGGDMKKIEGKSDATWYKHVSAHLTAKGHKTGLAALHRADKHWATHHEAQKAKKKAAEKSAAPKAADPHHATQQLAKKILPSGHKASHDGARHEWSKSGASASAGSAKLKEVHNRLIKHGFKQVHDGEHSTTYHHPDGYTAVTHARIGGHSSENRFSASVHKAGPDDHANFHKHIETQGVRSKNLHHFIESGERHLSSDGKKKYHSGTTADAPHNVLFRNVDPAHAKKVHADMHKHLKAQGYKAHPEVKNDTTHLSTYSHPQHGTVGVQTNKHAQTSGGYAHHIKLTQSNPPKKAMASAEEETSAAKPAHVARPSTPLNIAHQLVSDHVHDVHGGDDHHDVNQRVNTRYGNYDDHDGSHSKKIIDTLKSKHGFVDAPSRNGMAHVMKKHGSKSVHVSLHDNGRDGTIVEVSHR